MDTSLFVEKKYCGPPNSANGGYVSGCLAAHCSFTPTITLRKPPPLETALTVRVQEDKVALYGANDVLIADAVPGTIDLDIPAPPSWEDCEAARENYMGLEEHSFPNCFVCGPNRAKGDGLRVFSGRLEGTDIVAASWVPDAQLGDDTGQIRNEFLWSALDCPGAFAIRNKPPVVVLGRITAKIRGPITVGQDCKVIGWPLRSEGRKHWVGTAIFDRTDQLIAVASAIWIAI